MISQNCQARSAQPAYWNPPDTLSVPDRPSPSSPRWRDTLLLSAFLVAGLLIAFQLGVTLLQPPWKVEVTDWLRTSLAWLELLVLALVSLWLTRARRPESLTWWMISAGLLTYAIAQTIWVVFNQFISPNHVPVPWWSDLFFLLQYPCFFLALTFLPGTPPKERTVMSRVRVILDCILLMVAGTALSWYFLLEPFYMHSGLPLLGRVTNMAYPVGDLGVLFGLSLLLLRHCRLQRMIVCLLLVAVACLAIADSWFTFIDLHAMYSPGGPPDLFWMACYLLFPLAGLWQLRITRMLPTTKWQCLPDESACERALGRDVIDSFRFLFPFVLALLAGGLVMLRATLAPAGPLCPLISFAITFGLLLLVIVRQEITFLESERWRRERERARTNELLAMQEANQYMDTFLGMAGHELKTPLTSIKLALQLAERRSQRLLQGEAALAPVVMPFAEQLARAEHQTERLDRLVNDLLDVSRVQAGKLDLLPEMVDLAAILREAVEEQRQAVPERTILLRLPADQHLTVLADADRIGQVVTNYLTNALKYSPTGSPIEAGIDIDDAQVRVWVRDEGPGLPFEEQEHIWERFHRVKGIKVQSGTGVGLGLGLHICRTIVERHHGQVGVDSAPGSGSTFWFTLPR
ncbi:MAG TPA: ATP-binding protein [Ktedonobacterales bacterium]|nr:ATP-binding protein [Ktedonobacterales bacterium]